MTVGDDYGLLPEGIAHAVDALFQLENFAVPCAGSSLASPIFRIVVDMSLLLDGG